MQSHRSCRASTQSKSLREAGGAPPLDTGKAALDAKGLQTCNEAEILTNDDALKPCFVLHACAPCYAGTLGPGWLI